MDVVVWGRGMEGIGWGDGGVEFRHLGSEVAGKGS